MRSRFASVLLVAALGFALGGCSTSVDQSKKGKEVMDSSAPNEIADENKETSEPKTVESSESEKKEPKPEGSITKSEEEWQKELDPNVYQVTRKKGTERAFTGKYWDCKRDGTYKCACCGLDLFSSDTKFDSGTGWPSYYDAVDKKHIEEKRDTSYGMVRVEALCARCGAHLGHVFEDGPKPTGLRYCINSASLDLQEKSDGSKESGVESNGK